MTIISSIEYIYTDDSVLQITSLQTKPAYRGRGHASRLLKQVMREAKKAGMRTIELDDMSDRYRQEGNIYLAHGLRYVSDSGPEMTGEL